MSASSDEARARAEARRRAWRSSVEDAVLGLVLLALFAAVVLVMSGAGVTSQMQ